MIHKQLEDSMSLLAWNAGVCWVITPSSCLWPLTLGGVASAAAREAQRALHPHLAPGQGAMLCRCTASCWFPIGVRSSLVPQMTDHSLKPASLAWQSLVTYFLSLP